MSTKILSLCALAVVASATVACEPPHYSVGAARGPSRLTFAQRHHDVRHVDYLVDCKVDTNGKPNDCSTVDLPGDAE